VWPFKKKNNEVETFVAIRYTYEAFKALFPNKTKQEWLNENCPEDVYNFTKNSISRNANVIKDGKIKRILIATIDNVYLDWLLGKNKKHTEESINKYLKSKINDIDFWNKRLIDSGMTNTYNILGIPNMIMLHNFSGNSSNYSLNKETSQKLTNILKTIYKSEHIFVPGWFLKGCDAPLHTKEIVQFAELFWSEGTCVRFGQCLEQKYAPCELSDKFSPLYFVVPFVVKADINNALIYLNNDGCDGEDMSAQAMALMRFSDGDRLSLFNLIANDIPQVISIGPNAILPGQAYLSYQMGLIKRGFKQSNISTY
jgi:hypothetical protein